MQIEHAQLVKFHQFIWRIFELWNIYNLKKITLKKRIKTINKRCFIQSTWQILISNRHSIKQSVIIIRWFVSKHWCWQQEIQSENNYSSPQRKLRITLHKRFNNCLFTRKILTGYLWQRGQALRRVKVRRKKMEKAISVKSWVNNENECGCAALIMRQSIFEVNKLGWPWKGEFRSKKRKLVYKNIENWTLLETWFVTYI